MSQFAINATYGNLISYNSTIDSQIDIKEGIYNELLITLWDQNNNPLIFIDPELTLFLIVSTEDN